MTAVHVLKIGDILQELGEVLCSDLLLLYSVFQSVFIFITVFKLVPSGIFIKS